MKYIVRGRVEELRNEKGWTQKELSVKSGVPQAAISRFDKASNHTDWHLVGLARAFGVPIEELFAIEEEEVE